MLNKSLIVKKNCPQCNAVAIEQSRIDIGDCVLVTLKCKHTIVEDKIKASSYDLASSDGRSLRDFQKVGIKFAEDSNARCLIADEMGLGKTVQALGLLKLHPELLPCAIFVKSSTKLQWFYEVVRWCGAQNYLPQIIMDGKTVPVPGFPIYILSYDILRRLKPEVKESLKLKTVILDECQGIKNHLSVRAKEIQVLCKDVEHIIALSGTPIKNNTGEYFTILNLLQPRRFPEYASFVRDYCSAYDDGWSTKVGGLRSADYFRRQTEDFIIRRTRAEVAPELPTIQRNFRNVALENAFVKAYDKAQTELEKEYEKDSSSMMSAIEIMTRMRHLAGLSKVAPCVDFVEQFLLDTEPERKLTIFAHHLDVTAMLIANLKEMITSNGLDIEIEEINSSQDSQKRHEAVQRFQFNPKARLCVASTLAAGEGLNMQFCNDCVLLERQWNPANEEQVEGRFIRIGANGAPVTATYMIAVGTIDEFFTELVEQKRSIVAATMDNKEIEWNQQSLMKELLEAVAMRGGTRWRM